MDKNELFTYREIITQTEAWEEAVAAVEQCSDKIKELVKEDFQQIVFTGCGSTYYLSLSAAALFQEMTGLSSRAVPGGELLFNPDTILTSQKTLLVAISRSGSTSETVKAVEKFKRERNGKVLVITNYGDQPLAAMADLAIIIPKGQESSVAQTRSFASMGVAATAFSAVFANRSAEVQSMHRLAAVGSRLLTEYAELAHTIGADLSVDRFYFLGSGTRYGLACETNLKMKEMTLTHSEPFHFMEFRHGPMSMVTPNTVIIGMLSDSNRTQEQKVLQEMVGLGGRVISLADSNANIEFHSNISESVRGVLYLPVLQLMAFERSIAKGLNPDKPTNLSKVIKLDL
jgi:glucosamine--fructose-6-phosphate aminotransferase (isomerizing)